MNSWRLSSVMWPVRVRKSIPANHSSSVSCDLARERVQVAHEALRDRLEALGAGALERRQHRLRQLLVGQVAGAQCASSIVAGLLAGGRERYSGTAAAPGSTRSHRTASVVSSSSEKCRRKRSRTPSRCVGRAVASTSAPFSVSTA